MQARRAARGRGTGRSVLACGHAVNHGGRLVLQGCWRWAHAGTGWDARPTWPAHDGADALHRAPESSGPADDSKMTADSIEGLRAHLFFCIFLQLYDFL